MQARSAARLILLVALIVLGAHRPPSPAEITGAHAKDGRAAPAASITHGPILGRVTHDGVGVWIRTSRPAPFVVRYRSESGLTEVARGATRRGHDNTGWVHLTGLDANTRYIYTIELPEGGGEQVPGGTFRTLPHPDQYRHPEHNPSGLFNFSFEHGSCNRQFRRGEHGYSMPAYRTMLEQHGDELYFQIMNGDFTYEVGRGMTVEEWQAASGASEEAVPQIVEIAPDIVGVWENYKIYLDRSPELAAFHRHVPAFFMFDDHELLNDINATADVGARDETTLFRDIGVQAWHDYLGWSNPLPDTARSVDFGKARLVAGEDVLYDPEADFTTLRPSGLPTLHVHWNDAHRSAGVYEVVEVLGPHRLRLRPTPVQGGENLAYSIGMRNHFEFRVANSHFFVLDTRSHRERHDIRRPAQEGLSMIGEEQKRWLLENMRASDADFFFVTSTVSFTIPHVAPDLPEKDESWTVYLDEREELIDFFESLEKPVLLLTGDLHNGVAVKVSDRIWEFVSGPHNTGNHYATEEGDRPPSGPFLSEDRTVDIRWSSYFLPDVPRKHARQPYYVVFRANNVFNNPTVDGEDRWVAYPVPQVIVEYYDGLSGELVYAEAIAATRPE